MPGHDITGHARITHQWMQQERGAGSSRETQPGTQMPAGDSIEADMLVDIATFMEAPPEEYPPFDIEKFLRELPAVVPRNETTEADNVCLICFVKHSHESPETFSTEHPCRLPCGHTIGRACIAKWLKPHPEGSNANSCPFCRRPLFPAWPAIPSPPARNANILAVPRLTNFNDRREARRRARRPPNRLLDQELHEIEVGIGARVRRMEEQRGNTLRMRQPRVVNQQTNTPPTRLVGIVQQMQERGIDLPGPEPPRNAVQEHADWDARFEEFKRRMKEQGIVNMSGADLTRNASQEVDGHGVQAIGSHVRTVEDAGFHILPGTRRLHTTHDREEILGRRAANRRQVALRERDQYRSIIARGVHLPQPENPMDELLDYRQDQALFGWLQGHNAFQGLALNEAYRVERGGPRAGHTRTNREIYDMLRDCGIFWELQHDRNGRWRTRERFLFDDEEEDLSDTFQELLLEGALADPRIRRLVPDRDDYGIFRRVLEMRTTWDSERRQWQRRSSQTGILVVLE